MRTAACTGVIAQGTTPAALTAPRESGPAPLGADRSDLHLVGLIGVMLSDCFGAMQSALDKLAADSSANRVRLGKLKHALD